ncbi:hypothetical protein OSB04_010425 [Centaurea solstitialis]|uniref:Ubiquitin-like domain-containing protein n=1 Tax=Centaurea solstitialis TaxID=347529 RepID=A0AA38TKQ8_9ASTR|nr:hypothetical protein OSB04_010425 [Centaurea solstitialis]
MAKQRIYAIADKITIIVKDQHNNTMYFMMSKNYPLRKILVAFCKRKQIDYRTVTFIYDGSRVRPDSTPMQLKMEDNDEIQVMSIVWGGGYA